MNGGLDRLTAASRIQFGAHAFGLRWVIALIAFAAIACGDAPRDTQGPKLAPDVRVACPFGEPVAEICPPEPPRVPESCPGEMDGGVCLPLSPDAVPAQQCPGGGRDGVCAPVPPAFAERACPLGWTERDVDLPPEAPSVGTCEAPSPGPQCGDAERPALVAGGCAPLGRSCPDEDWPAEAELRARAPGFEGRVLYVSTAGGGDGSREAPLGSLGDAVRASSSGDIIALSKGRWTGRDRVNRRVAVLGACASQTELAAPELVLDGDARLVFSASALLSDVTVSGRATGIDVRGPRTAVVAEGIHIRDAKVFGVAVDDGAEFELRDSFVDQVSPADDGSFGAGLDVRGGGRARVLGSAVRAVFTYGLGAAGDSRLEVEDTWIAKVAPERASNGLGFGILSALGATTKMGRVRIDNATTAAIFAGEATVEAVDVHVSAPDGTRSSACALAVDAAEIAVQGLLCVGAVGGAVVALDGHVVLGQATIEDVGQTVSGQGRGLTALRTGTIVGSQVVTTRTTESAATVEAGGRIELFDFVGAYNLGDPGQALGHGVGVLDGAISLERAVLADIGYVGALVDGGALRAVDVLFARPRPFENRLVGQAAQCVRGDLELERASLMNASEAGIGAVADPSDPCRLRLAHVRVQGTRASLESQVGSALVARGGVELTGHHTILRDNSGYGVLATQGAVVLLEDARMEDHGLEGRATVSAVSVTDGARVELTRAWLERQHRLGVSIHDAGVVLTDVTVVDTRRDESGELGIGVAIAGGTLGAQRLRVAESRTVGLLSNFEAVVSLRDVHVSLTGPGADGLGLGVAFARGTDATMDRAYIQDSIGAGVGVFVASAELRDLQVRDVASTRVAGRLGIGVVLDTSDIEGARWRVEGARSAGLSLIQADVQVEDLSVSGTRAEVCAEPDAALTCPEGGGGSGVFVHDSELVVERFAIFENELAGLQVAPRGRLTAARGVVYRNAIGLNIRSDDVDISRDFTEVVVQDNGTDVDLSELRTPSALEVLDALGEVEGSSTP